MIDSDSTESLTERQQYVRKYYSSNKEYIKEKSRRWRVNNLEKSKRATRAWVLSNPERRHQIQFKSRLKRKYGIEPKIYQELFNKQHGVCAICKEPESNTTSTITALLAVDHDHVTGQIRGLLCKGCNIALGSMKDSPERLRAAATYLEERL